MPWSTDQISKIAAANDLYISPFRNDGVTPGTPTWIWSVVVGGDLYVRAYHGRSSRWYNAAIKQRAGRITVAGLSLHVGFDPVDNEELSARIDAAYREKYRTSQYLGSMIGSRARAATIRILPLSA